MGDDRVALAAVGVGVAGPVHPVTGPLFAEGGIGEEAVGEIADGGFRIADGVGLEGGGFFGSGR